jgi:uncharacterized repeat protein (TIGR01451 family)
VTDTITSAPVLTIGKTSLDANGGDLEPGDTITYTIVVTNTGNANATGGVISDSLPSNTDFVDGSISLTPALASNLTITANESVTVTYAVVVDTPLANGTQIENTASVTSSEVTTPVEDSVSNTVSSAPLLTIGKSAVDANGGDLEPGDTITYTIVVTNTGNANATGGLVSDSLPLNTGFVLGSIKLESTGTGVAGGFPPTLASGLTIMPSESVTVSYAVVVNTILPDQTKIVNTASVTSNEVSLVQSSTVTDTVVSAPLLTIQKSSLDANGGSLVPGDRITYTVVVRNNGTATATGGLVSDSVPLNTGFVLGSIKLEPAGAGVAGGFPPTLASGLTIMPSESVTISYAVVVNTILPDQTKIANTAAVTSNEVSLAQSSTVTDTVVSAPILSIQKSSLDANGGALVPGDRITYTVVVRNNGTATATGGLVSDSLPLNTGFVLGSIKLESTGAGVAGGFPPTLASGLTIMPSESVTVSYAVVVNTILPDQTKIVNTASVTSNEVSLAQSSTVTDTVVSAPLLTIQKSSLDANGGSLVPGDRITYTVVVRNNGTATATGGLVSDSVPANTTFVPGSIALDPPSAGTQGTSLPTLASNLTIGANEGVTVSYAVLVNTPLPDQTQIVNTAIFSSNEILIPIKAVVTDTITGQNLYYFPLILKGSVADSVVAPDLVVENINFTSNNVQVVIRNQGNGPVIQSFWVDLYVDPDPIPTNVNETWNDGRSREGIVWGVWGAALPLDPGEALTLTFNDAYYDPINSVIAWPQVTNASIYVQVDSANTTTNYGAVYESHEITRTSYNNISNIIYTATATETADEQVMQTEVPVPIGKRLTDHLPARP